MSMLRFSVWVPCAFLLSLASTTSAAPCAGFIDVQDTDQFCTEITWLRNRAITLGCTATQYCPAQFVRRDQMAAFLYRLGVQNAFLQGGNAFGATAVLGTADARALQLQVDNARALTLAPATNTDHGSSPNLVGGHPGNVARITCPGICLPPHPAVGGVVAGGGRGNQPNRVTDSFGVIGGGYANLAGNDDANSENAPAATVDSNNIDFTSLSSNVFRVRATGGVAFVTDIDGAGNTTWACSTSSGNSWSCASDRNLKHSLVELDGRAVLAKVAALPVYQWQPTGQNAHVKHFGPMAQDFHAAFGLGDDTTMIGMQDADGVALAAIKGLNAKLEQQNAEQEARLSEQAKEIAELRRVVEMLVTRTSTEGRLAHAR